MLLFLSQYASTPIYNQIFSVFPYTDRHTHARTHTLMHTHMHAHTLTHTHKTALLLLLMISENHSKRNLNLLRQRCDHWLSHLIRFLRTKTGHTTPSLEIHTVGIREVKPNACHSSCSELPQYPSMHHRTLHFSLHKPLTMPAVCNMWCSSPVIPNRGYAYP